MQSTSAHTVIDHNINDFNSSSCDDIQSLKAQLTAQSEIIRRLQQDMQALNTKYVAEIERAAETLYQKDMVEQELEELSRRLFEQANDMVAQEKRAKWELENQLKRAQEQLAAEQSQLKELRLQQQQDTVLQRSTSSSTSSSSSITASSSSALSKATALTEYYTPATMESFKHFAGQSPFSATTNANVPKPQKHRAPLMKLHQQFVFLKMCQEDDVEPCLRFGPHSRWSVKKMIEYLLRQPCFIEKIDPYAIPPSTDYCGTPSPAYNRPLWERWIEQPSAAITSMSSSSTLSCCSACGEPSTDLDYRFRFDVNEDWSRIDRYCRDRLVAVCEFYVFIRNIHMGLYADRDVHMLYEETVRLRLQMFYARMGALRDIGPQPLLDADKEEDEEDAVSLNGSVSTVSTSSTSEAPQTPIEQEIRDNSGDLNSEDDLLVEQEQQKLCSKQKQHMVRSRSWTVSHHEK
ncbi:hypothetical protein BDB00DRAFT_913938 [Zychaea mexicana]|uniref:uncharacterized protein n=1 Tax=Zychaea mexicana TaxID=64656 RepID=UPI0022FE62DB|nr:uncharacterized protein BDB00DRAFT_913938 [Zychaea mexicana]KAI9498140.1 hypothetical protein BDB00DRAFT_913938 [Zychaea mexicana]